MGYRYTNVYHTIAKIYPKLKIEFKYKNIKKTITHNEYI